MNEMARRLATYEDSSWMSLPLDAQAKYEASLELLAMMCESWYRLVFVFKAPECQILCVARFDACQVDEARKVAESVINKERRCHSCVNNFAATWAHRLQSDSNARACKAVRRPVGKRL